MSENVKKKGNPVVVMIVAFLNALFVVSMASSSLSYFLVEISTEFNLTAVQGASLSAGVSTGTLVAVLFTGILMDRVSTRVLLCIGGLVAAFSVIARSWVHSYMPLYLLFILFGVATAIVSPGGNKMVSLWFDKKWTFLCNSILISAGATSYFVGLNATRPIAAMLGGWRQYYVALTIVMAIIAVCWLIFVREKSSKDAVLNASVGVTDIEKNSLFDNLKYVLKSPKAWCCFIAEAGFGGTIMVLISLTTTALVNSWGLPQQTAATMQSWSNAGSFFGYWLLPVLMMKFYKGDEALPVGISAGVSTILWIWAMMCYNNDLFKWLFAIGGFLNGLGYTGPRSFLMRLPEVAGLRSGTALGIFQVIYRAGVIVMTTAAAAVGAAMSTPGTLDGYNKGLAIMFICGFLSPIFMGILAALNKKDAKKAKAAAAQ